METKRKIKLWCFASLDGFIARYDGDMDFVAEHKNPSRHDYGFKAFYDAVGCGLMNRLQQVNQQSNELWPVADKPCFILTKETFPVPPKAQIQVLLVGAQTSLMAHITELRNRLGGDIWLIGDHDLISDLLRKDLIDEITVNILPVTIGGGQPLFISNGKETRWELVGSRSFDNGVVQSRYRVISDSF